MSDDDLTDIVRIEVPGHSPFQIAHSGDTEGTYQVELIIPNQTHTRLQQALGAHFVLTRSRLSQQVGAQLPNKIVLPIGPGVVLIMRNNSGK